MARGNVDGDDRIEVRPGIRKEALATLQEE